MLKKLIKNSIKGYLKKFYRREIISSSIINSMMKLRYNEVFLIDNILSCEALVFSKDRVMQLHALLSSYFKYVENPVPLTILYTYSNNLHKNSYDELIEIFKGKEVKFIKENNFRKQLLEILNQMKSEKIFFMTDDSLFIDSFDLNDYIKFNPLVCVADLKKGLDKTYCFAHQMNQEFPEFIDEIADENYKIWKWEQPKNSPDWSYPLSVDSNLFNLEEIKILLKNIEFRAPNSLEGNMQLLIDFFIARYGVCFNKAKYTPIPINLVQTEGTNSISKGYTAEELLEKWNKNLRVHYELFYKKSCSIVQKSNLEFIKRK